MNTFIQKNLTTLIIVFATIVLAAIAIFTSIRLYQTRQNAVAPNAPSSRPAAASLPPAVCQTLAFTISTPTPTPTGTATATPTGTPTPTPVAQCGTTCTTNSDCPTSMVCYVGDCRNPSCTTSSTCLCATVTPSPTATPTGTATATPIAVQSPTATPVLPTAGSVTPTILGVAAGAILLIASIALVL